MSGGSKVTGRTDGSYTISLFCL